jgi:glycosyltransferase involved in cell wall biosynthesis
MRVCLVSSVHPWINPRAVKEADWLVAHGHEVHLVTKRVHAWSDRPDESLLASKRWHATRVNLLRDDPEGRRRWLATALRAELAIRAFEWTGNRRLAEAGYYRGFAEVLDAAVQTCADLYIAHTQGALPIAAQAAARHGVPFAFDCEDLLAEEAADGLQRPRQRRAILEIERTYLPLASYVTATSQAMAAYLESHYALTKLFVVRNVFPLADLNGVPAPRQRASKATVELVWISAAIGAGRGLADAVRALAMLPDHVRLTLFGRMLPAYEEEFWSLVRELELGNRVSIQPVLDHAAIMPTLAHFDVGLTLDLNNCLNRSLTIANKVYHYLQAGLALIATDTPGHHEALRRAPGAGVIVAAGDVQGLASALRNYVDHADDLLNAKEAAWCAGQTHDNWDRESDIFRSALETIAL